MKAVCPCPEPALKDKYHYFYTGYNQRANTQKFMMFDQAEAPYLGSGDLWEYNLLKQLKEGSVELTREQNERLFELIEAATQERVDMSSKGWKKVYEFMFSQDDRLFLFVMNQLRKMLGNRKPIPKRSKTQKHKQAIEEKRNKIF